MVIEEGRGEASGADADLWYLDVQANAAVVEVQEWEAMRRWETAVARLIVENLKPALSNLLRLDNSVKMAVSEDRI